MESDNMNKDKIENLLKCRICGTPFVFAKDSIVKRVTGYLYKPNCKCYEKEIRISVG